MVSKALNIIYLCFHNQSILQMDHLFIIHAYYIDLVGSDELLETEHSHVKLIDDELLYDDEENKGRSDRTC